MNGEMVILPLADVRALVQLGWELTNYISETDKSVTGSIYGIEHAQKTIARIASALPREKSDRALLSRAKKLDRPNGHKTMNNATESQIAAAFSEWERRYREEPKRFQSEASKLLKTTPDSYGAACSPYFLAILAEVQAKG